MSRTYFDLKAEYGLDLAPIESFDFYGEPILLLQNRQTEFCSKVFPNVTPSDIKVEHLESGRSNHVASITIGEPSAPKWSIAWFKEYDDYIDKYLETGIIMPPYKSYILRIPRDLRRDSLQMDYDVAALCFARRSLSLPIPAIYRSDSGNSNAFGMPYMLQERLPGQRLDRVLDILTPHQRKRMVRLTVKVLKEMRSITSAIPGVIAPDTNSIDRLFLSDFQASGTTNATRAPSQHLSTTHFLLNLCHRRLADSRRGEDADIFRDFRGMVCALHDRGFLPDEDQFHFCHLDLRPRNILVDVATLFGPELTGIIDWDPDYVGFCPKFVAYGPPFWLWLDDSAQEMDEAYAAVEPKIPINKAMKKYFEKRASAEWMYYAYTPEYILARRMFRYLILGINSTTEGMDAQSIADEWEKIHEIDGHIGSYGPWNN